MNIKTLPLSGAFLKGLAQRICDLTQGDPLGMGGAVVLLPTRRACRALELLLLENSSNQATVLPKIIPMGEGDMDDLIFLDDGEVVSIDHILNPQLYQALLTNLTLKFGVVWESKKNGPGIAQAANLALNLMQLLNQVETEGLSFQDLEGLVPHEYAEHWQITLDFLKIITQYWPEILKVQGKMTPAALRRLLTNTMANNWANNPPHHVVIAAGSTGTIPATAHLLKVIAGLPRGEVILPGFIHLPSNEAEVLSPAHPQYTMYQLLKKLEADPHDVISLMPPAPRDLTYIKAFGGGLSKNIDVKTFGSLQLAECAHLQEEADVIALKIREVLENPTSTALLVTPDPGLSMRVTMSLRRFGIHVDDSAGRLFSKSPGGTLLRLTAQWCAKTLSASLILGTLKHPMVQGVFDRHTFLILVRILERYVLRKGRIFASLTEMACYVATTPCPVSVNKDLWESLHLFLKELNSVVAPLQQFYELKDVSLKDLIMAHQSFLGFLKLGNSQASLDDLFPVNSDESIVAKSFWENWIQASSLLTLPTGQEYLDLLDSFLAPLLVRPSQGQHPRVAILGPMEARLMSADQIILGGLNEDIWPPSPKGDPWFSMDMREKFGLPPYQRRIGLSAHDFLEHLGATDVLLTRSLQMDSSPTTPSRFLVKLETLLKPHGLILSRASDLIAWARSLSLPQEISTAKKICPKPCPPVATRPMKLSITDVTNLIHNPYDVYAKHILNLQPLDPLDFTPGALEYGIILHEVFHELLPILGTQGALEKGLFLGDTLFDQYFKDVGFQDFWRLKFEHSLKWFLRYELENTSIQKRFGEVSGALNFETPMGQFTLICKADRIDLLINQTWQILDYKTGKLPTQKAIATGHAPQLPLEAAVLKFGRFEGIPTGFTISGLSFVGLTGKIPAGDVVEIKGDPNELANHAFQSLKTIVFHFLHPETPYEAGFKSLIGTYDHLARIQEVSFFGREDS